MTPTYFKYRNIIEPLHEFYAKQHEKDISLPNRSDRFFLKEFQLFIKDFWITNILMMKDDKDRWKRSNKEQRLK